MNRALHVIGVICAVAGAVASACQASPVGLACYAGAYFCELNRCWFKP